MQTVHIDRVGPETAAQKAAIVLAAGGIVLYPTDTLYGLAVDATNAKALEQLYALKGREPGKPVSVVVPDTESMERFGHLNDAARTLAGAFLPGALTLIVPATSQVPVSLAHEGNVALRIPDDEFCLALARAFKRPFTATSANLASLPTLATIEEIVEQLGASADMIAMAIDDGPREGGVPSTIVSCVTDTPEIIREGKLNREMIAQALEA